jgi:glucan-binding YG repeat protein
MKRVNIKKYLLLVGMAAVFTVATAMVSFASTALESPDDLYWSNNTKKNDDREKEGPIARWEKVENAHNYQVYVYYEEEYLTDVKTKNNYYNFRSKMTKVGNYSFKVRALSKDSSKYRSSSYSEMSEDHYVNENAVENADIPDEKNASIVGNSEWKQDDKGWWYRYANGSYPSNGWFQDPAGGNWYYMDQEGYMVTGWIENNGQRYYLAAEGTPAGAMVTGDYTIDGILYHFDANGALMQ